MPEQPASEIREGTERQDARGRHNVVPDLGCAQYRNAPLAPAFGRKSHPRRGVAPNADVAAELDLAPLHGRAAQRAPAASSSPACATPVTGRGSAISSGTACPPSSTPRSWPSRASSSRCRKPSGARSPSRIRRTSAATRCSATSARRASATGASSSTSAPRSRPRSSRAATRRGGGCADRTNGRRALPTMQPTVLEWMRAMDRVGLAVLRALALGLGQPLDHFDDVVLPRGDPHLKIIRYPAQPRDAGHGPRRRHASRLGARVVRAARRRRRACRSSSTASSSTRRRSPAPTS